MASFIQDAKARSQQRTSLMPDKAKEVSDILLWQQNPSALLTQRILLKIKPTIESALHTYVPGQLSAYRIKATTYALSSLKNYDPKKKVSPNTFVFSLLRRLSRIKRLRLNIVHVPLSQVYLQAQINKALTLFLDMYYRLPSDLLLADKLHVSKAKLAKMLLGKLRSIVPDSAAVNAVTGQSTFSKPSVTLDDYFDYVYRSVSPQDKLIMQYTSGRGRPALSNNEIAKKLKLSPGAVSQRKAKLQSMLSLVRGLL